MDENVGKDLAQDMKQELKETNKYYENVKLELSKIRLENIVIEEKHKQEIDKNNEINEVVEYGILIKFKGEHIKIATINEEGKLIPNKDILENVDKKYTDEELSALGDMINRIGLEQDKVDINKLKEQLQELEAKSEKEFKENEVEKEHEEEESIKDEEKEKEEQEIKDDKELEEQENETRKKKLAKMLGVREKDIVLFKINAQLFENHQQISKTTFLFRDKDGKFKAREFNDGKIEESPFFKDSTTHLITDKYVNLGKDGQDIEREVPWQVMETNNLKARNTQGIRMAIRMEQGEYKVEEIRQGTDGKWTGFEVDVRGRDYNAKAVDKLSDTRTSKVAPADINKRFEAVEHSGLADDGVQMQDLSPRKTIDRFMEEGYNKKEAIDIYNYMIGPQKLPEDAAKNKVNEEIEKRIERESKKRQEGGRDQGEEAFDRLHNRRH